MCVDAFPANCRVFGLVSVCVDVVPLAEIRCVPKSVWLAILSLVGCVSKPSWNSRSKSGAQQAEQGMAHIGHCGVFRVWGNGCAGLSEQGLARLAKLWQAEGVQGLVSKA